MTATMNATRIWHGREMINLEIGQEVTVLRCSTGHYKFGEPATLTKITDKHLVFTTESGAIAKTKADNLHHTIGKAEAAGYFVSLRSFDSFTQMMREKVSYWNSKKRAFENK